jgi:hypothetical protein
MNNISQITEMVAELVKSQLGEEVTLTAIERTTQTMLQESRRETKRMGRRNEAAHVGRPQVTNLLWNLRDPAPGLL